MYNMYIYIYNLIWRMGISEKFLFKFGTREWEEAKRP